MIDKLITTAEKRGYRVRWHTKGPKAAWLPQQQAITLRHGMDDVQTLCALAHELGHAHYDDPPGHFDAHELRADRFAAKLLINPDDYRLLETTFGPHPGRLAHELGVTVNVLKTWQTLHESKIAL
ncbi:ImmA/IrrE family metallo-endopeptidase [Corynebacterium sp. J010B-136]|uniref:ImmA/IrrE family metallo-endopeptidase n=1 Tax=Corynebacterium sp. J010B-136 TaxID=2099401 RepID=UPI000CF9887D|nr:ImmA/IrrE family metallo-endopeptidase [Corynebacterium sp. J010B-136]PQM75358.1 ImmA/IrrE family metallo-endopeptidase [Corynebacterium sp. J010B-136]